jgi:hypothetical protein
MITWGDGMKSAGTVTVHAGGGFDVAGSHTYAAVGSYSASVAITGPLGTSTAAPFAVTVKHASSTVVKTSVNPSVFGQPVTFTATVHPGAGASGLPTGGVMFKDSATVLGSGKLLNGQATFSTASLARAGHTITAAYSGDANFSTSTSIAFGQTVRADASITRTSSSPSPTVFGQRATFTAVLTAKAPGAGTPTGTVTFKDGTVGLGRGMLQVVGGVDRATFTTNALSVGSHTITAIYGGSTDFFGSSASVVQKVTKDATSTAVKSSLNPSVAGQAVTFTATVHALLPGSGIASGTVIFKDGTNILGSAPLNSAGQATFSTASLSVGNHSITAIYGGDGHFTGDTSAPFGQSVKSHSILGALQRPAANSPSFQWLLALDAADIDRYFSSPLPA